jgi:hypothetical protein
MLAQCLDYNPNNGWTGFDAAPVQWDCYDNIYQVWILWWFTDLLAVPAATASKHAGTASKQSWNSVCSYTVQSCCMVQFSVMQSSIHALPNVLLSCVYVLTWLQHWDFIILH